MRNVLRGMPAASVFQAPSSPKPDFLVQSGIAGIAIETDPDPLHGATGMMATSFSIQAGDEHMDRPQGR